MLVFSVSVSAAPKLAHLSTLLIDFPHTSSAPTGSFNSAQIRALSVNRKINWESQTVAHSKIKTEKKFQLKFRLSSLCRCSAEMICKHEAGQTRTDVNSGVYWWAKPFSIKTQAFLNPSWFGWLPCLTLTTKHASLVIREKFFEKLHYESGIVLSWDIWDLTSFHTYRLECHHWRHRAC